MCLVLGGSSYSYLVRCHIKQKMVPFPKVCKTSLFFTMIGAGGGSGGSIWITTSTFGGHGTESVNGGTGSTRNGHTSGSGAGGRIAIHITTANNYRGNNLALGGTGVGNLSGGPGTVFVEEKRGFKYYKMLYVDGNNADPAKALIIEESNPRTVELNKTELNNATFGFDDLTLTNMVC